MEIVLKQQDELSGEKYDNRCIRNTLGMLIGIMGILVCLKEFVYDGIYTSTFYIILFILSSLIFVLFFALDLTRKPKITPEFLEFASLKENKQFIMGKVTKVDFLVSKNKSDMCKIYVLGDDGFNYYTDKWISLTNLLSTDLVKMKDKDGRFEVTEAEKIALIDRECCIYKGKNNNYLEVYTGDTLVRATLKGVLSLC